MRSRNEWNEETLDDTCALVVEERLAAVGSAVHDLKTDVQTDTFVSPVQFMRLIDGNLRILVSVDDQ